MRLNNLFDNLYNADNEEQVEKIIQEVEEKFSSEVEWKKLGNQESNYGVVENQQSHPVGALIEKLTNSIDAILMKKCREAEIDPESKESPQSMREAVEKFYSKSYKNWDLSQERMKQAEDIQILAHGKKTKPTLTIYDNGEGQHPEDFEKTFLSLLTGNKQKIKFAQGMYNMGGSGSIAFCGEKKYQLIGSRRYDKSGDFGFTVIRMHPLTEEEAQKFKCTFYEFLTIENKIPSFKLLKPMDLKLHNRLFECGTIVRLYSYDLPPGSRSAISRDLNMSINEFLVEPGLPILTVEDPKRYPKDINPFRDLYGLKRRLETEYVQKQYIDDRFSEKFEDKEIGELQLSYYLFKTKVKDKSVKDTKSSIRAEFFKNNMSVMFSLNGQVHGYWTTEFISKSLGLKLLKDYLLIHVDCTKVDPKIRQQLFMASRDRLKKGKETEKLRKFLKEKLTSKNSRLVEIEKNRRNNLLIDSGSHEKLIEEYTKSLPMNDDLMKLLGDFLKLDKPSHLKSKSKKKIKNKKSDPEKEIQFIGKRYPSFFKYKNGKNGEIKTVVLPKGGSKTITFLTDAEDHYLDRSEDPGDFIIKILGPGHNETDGGSGFGKPGNVTNIFNVRKTSPHNGVIRVNLEDHNDKIQVDDRFKLSFNLSSGENETLEVIVDIEIVKELEKENEKKAIQNGQDYKIGLPELILVYKERKEETSCQDWQTVEENTGQEFEYGTVLFPLCNRENKLEKIFINMDSHILKKFISKNGSKNEEQINVCKNKYISTVYFHAVFFYSILAKEKYEISKEDPDKNSKQEMELQSFIKDFFETPYSEFLLTFGSENLITILAD